MAVRGGVVQIDVQAGTAKFIVDMEQAKAKIRELGTAHGHTVTETKALNSAMKVLEGNFLANARAADGFMEKILKLGPVAQAAFPIIGAVAFAGIISETATKVYDFFEKLKEAPEKASAAFRELNLQLQTSNDELQVSNDRLENEIAKLQNKPQNTLKLALDEAIVSADHLADSLDKDLTKLEKVLSENQLSMWERIFGGKAGTADIPPEVKNFHRSLNELINEETLKIRGLTNLKEKDAAETERNSAVLKAYSDEIVKLNKELDKAEGRQKIFQYEQANPGTKGVFPETDQTDRIKALRSVIMELAAEGNQVNLGATHANLTDIKDEAEAAKLAAEQVKKLADIEKQRSDMLSDMRHEGLLSLQRYSDEDTKKQAQAEKEQVSTLQQMRDEGARSLLHYGDLEMRQQEQVKDQRESAMAKLAELDTITSTDRYKKNEQALLKIKADEDLALFEWQQRLNKGVISQEAFERARVDVARKASLERQQLIDQEADRLQSFFDRNIRGAKSFADAFKHIASDLERVAEKIIFKQIAAWLTPAGAPSGGTPPFLGKGGVGSFIGSIFKGLAGFASGGDIYGPAIVGEQGPELFVPSGPGRIVPNGKIGGTSVVYNVDARGADAGVEMRVYRAIQLAHADASRRGAFNAREMALRTPSILPQT